MDSSFPEIRITERDHERLTSILSTLRADHPVAALLGAELDRAEVVASEDIPPDTVTMNSQVVLELPDGSSHTVTLVYPNGADFSAGRLSVLAPVGAALLGLRVGQTISWPMPDGQTRTVRVIEVVWQPEAAGDFSL